jgi:hypothetical protein
MKSLPSVLKVLVLSLAVATAARAEENRGRMAPSPSDQKKLTVADVLKGLSLDESALSFSDEPPGKLRTLSCETTLRDTKLRVRVRIELVYTVALFSAERHWDPKAVRAAAVHQVTLTPAAGP